MRQSYDDRTSDENELEITDLHENIQSNHEVRSPDHIEWIASPKKAVAKPSGQFFIRIRVGLGIMTLVCFVLLSFLLWPTVAPSANRLLGLQKPQPTATPRPKTSTQSYSMITPIGNVVCIYSTQFNLPYTTLEAVSARNGTHLWTYKGGTILSWPAFSDGIIYVSSTHGLDALRPGDGSIIWHKDTGLLQNTPFIQDGILYVSVSHTLEALRSSNGAVIWQQTTAEDVFGVGGNIVYTGSMQSTGISARRATDGSVIWHYDKFGGFWLNSSSQLNHGIIYAYEESGVNISALNPADGAQLWHYAINNSHGQNEQHNNVLSVSSTEGVTLEGSHAPDGSLQWHYDNIRQTWSTAEGDLYTFTGDGATLRSLNAHDGSIRWQQNIAITQLLLEDNGILYTQLGSGGLTALRASDGATLWQRDIGGIGNIQVQNDKLYITNNGGVFSLRVSDGALLWRTAVETRDLSAPGSGREMLIEDGVLYLGLFYFRAQTPINVIAIRLQDGKLLWISQKMLHAFIVAHAGVTYLSTYDGEISARRSSDGALRWHYRITPPGTTR